MKERATVRADAWRYDEEYLMNVSRIMESNLLNEQVAFDAQSTNSTPAFLEGRANAVSTVSGVLSASLSTDRLTTNSGLLAIKDISDIVLEMRNLFNLQQLEHQSDNTIWVLEHGSVETLARTTGD